jgi:hypothetical protein
MASPGSYRKYNDRTQNSSTYHKKDGTPVRAVLKEEARKEIEAAEVVLPVTPAPPLRKIIISEKYSINRIKKLMAKAQKCHRSPRSWKVTFACQKWLGYYYVAPKW